MCFRAWEFIARNVKKRGSLLVTVPSLEESLSKLQVSSSASFSQHILSLSVEVAVLFWRLDACQCCYQKGYVIQSID